ncbi:MAG TPA: hypothetical protein VGJ94_14210 [Syntrophorhabdaceae bacterium]|jgi:predicted RNA binding protein YcfA (HicA-like mRNA interferase family)
MTYPPHIWNQLKNTTAKELKKALDNDENWQPDGSKGSILLYSHPDGRKAGIHFHSGKTYGPKMLKGLLDYISWSENEMRELGLIK